MAKIGVHLNGMAYLFEDTEAVEFLRLLAKAEIYREVWKPGTEGSLHYVYQQGESRKAGEPSGKFNLVLLSDELYRMAKLAGCPE